MKIKDERETQKKKKNKDRKEKEDREAFSERVRAKWFCCAFKLGFLQLICQVSLIVNSNLELALSIIFKQRELCETKHVVMEYTCLKIWDLLSFFMFLNPSLKLQLAQLNLYTKKDFKSLGIGSLYEK